MFLEEISSSVHKEQLDSLQLLGYKNIHAIVLGLILFT